MAAARNRRFVLASRPKGEPSPDNFGFDEVDVPEPGSGQMLLRTIYLSLDPYMRGRMNAEGSYTAPVEIGDVMEGGTVSEVVASNISEYQPGDIVLSRSGWQEYAISDGDEIRKIDPKHGPISHALSVLGMPGFTAYTGLLNIGQPKEGETLVVAAASGAVGSVVGQVAKIKGCRVVGIAGGGKKCRHVVDELGFDVCLDHHEPDLGERLKAACPDGIDIYYENVGGPVLESVFPLLNNFARVPVCGLIAWYNDSGPFEGPDRLPSFLLNVLFKRLTFRGFIVGDFNAQLPDFLNDMSGWLREGRVKYLEDITEGLENAPRELIALLKGGNFGKKIIKVAADPTST